MNTTLLNIPAHTNCINCGHCCGVFPIDEDDVRRILNYMLKGHWDVLKVVKTPKTNFLVCPFRNEKLKRCAIYPVRPLICRLFGVSEGMNCDNGNSSNIDGRKFTDQYQGQYMINTIDWVKMAKEVANLPGLMKYMRKAGKRHEKL